MMQRRIWCSLAIAACSWLTAASSLDADGYPDWAVEIQIQPDFPDGISAPIDARLVPSLEPVFYKLLSTSDPHLLIVKPHFPGKSDRPEALTLVFRAGGFPPVRDNLFDFQFLLDGSSEVARKVARPKFRWSDAPYIVDFQQSISEANSSLSLDLGVSNPTEEPISIVGVHLAGRYSRGSCNTRWSKIKLQVEVIGVEVLGVAEVENSQFTRRKKLKGNVSNCGSLTVGMKTRIEVPASRQVDIELVFDASNRSLLGSYEWWEVSVTLDVNRERLLLSNSLKTDRELRYLEDLIRKHRDEMPQNTPAREDG